MKKPTANDIWQEDYAPQHDSEPSESLPGTQARIEEMRERVANGSATVFNDKDRTFEGVHGYVFDPQTKGRK